MTERALAGLAALNLLYLGSGIAIMWLIRGFATWTEVARLAGLAFLVGVSFVGVSWSLLLIVGVPFGQWMVLVVPLLAIGLSALVGRRRGRGLPRRGMVTVGRMHLIGAFGIAAAGVALEAAFRASRLAGLHEWDAWSFWVPKAQVLYHLGELDPWFFTTLPGSSYPPLVPVLDAAVFHAMGSVDVVTLHVQYWLFGVAFIWGLAGLLAEKAQAWMVWPFVLLVIVAPRIGRRLSIAEADLFLDFLFVLAALLVLFWLLDGEGWRLLAAAILMGGMVMTKREGLLFAVVLVAAALVASAREWRRTLPRLAFLAVAVALVAAPWRLWYIARGVEGEGPSGGIDPTESTDRLWPSIRLAIDVLFSNTYWSVAVPVAIGAIVLAFVVRAFRPAVFFAVLVALVTLGGAWFTWAIPGLPITQEFGGNPIVRYMGAAALVCAAAAPLLLSATWSAVTEEEKEAGVP